MEKESQVGAINKIPTYWILTHSTFPLKDGVRISNAKPNDQIPTAMHKRNRCIAPGVCRYFQILVAKKKETNTLENIRMIEEMRFTSNPSIS